jgi:hypothetical protein
LLAFLFFFFFPLPLSPPFYILLRHAAFLYRFLGNVARAAAPTSRAENSAFAVIVVLAFIPDCHP